MLCPTWDVERDASAVTLAVPTRAELGDDAAANRGGAASVTDASSSSATPPPTLTIDVFDEDAGGQRSHDHLGRVYVPWSTLVARSDVVTLPLVHADQSGSKSRGAAWQCGGGQPLGTLKVCGSFESSSTSTFFSLGGAADTSFAQ